MKDCEIIGLSHLPNALLIKAIDDELTGAELLEVESHLPMCEPCGRRYQSLRQLSTSIESAVDGPALAFSKEERGRLERQLEAQQLAASTQRSSHALRRLSWAMAIAAAAAFVLLFAPQWKHSAKTAGSLAAFQPGTLEVDGENFVALPYSNPDLPLNASHIVEMQVPVSSLADAGIVFEPISNEMAAPDRAVLADVLFGMDGRPIGIHVLNNE
jgi:hypothetical protein